MPKSQLHFLSAVQIDRIKPTSKDQMFNDGGGLYLFNRQYGKKEWIFRYTSPVTKNRRKQSIGAYPDTPIKEARRIAGSNRDLLAKGVDPLLKYEESQISEREKLSERKAKQLNTVEAIFDIYTNEELKNRKYKGEEAIRIFKKDVFPVIGKKPINEVTKLDIKEVLKRPLKRKANRIANITLSELKQFFSYADDEELITRDPTRKLTKKRTGGIEPPRERVLSEDELFLLKDKLPASKFKQANIHAIYLFLATGCRRTEIEHLNKKKEVNLSEKTLFIPRDRSKNTDAHLIYLSDFALKQIIAISKLTDNETWLLPNDKNDGPVTKGTITKQVTDRQPRSEDAKPIKNRKNDNSLELPGGHWIVHDLRRTAATIMQELGVMPYIIKKCLNQRIDDKIMQTYQRAKLIEEQKDAFNKLGAYLSNIFE